jgi:hypothetical protein
MAPSERFLESFGVLFLISIQTN